MADKDDLLAELVFKKHQERALARQNKINAIPEKAAVTSPKFCDVCNLVTPCCVCKTPVTKAEKAKSDMEKWKKENPVIGSPSWFDTLPRRSNLGQAKPHFFTLRSVIPAGAKVTLNEIVRQIMCVTSIDFKCDGPILLSNLLFGNIPIWPLNNEIHIQMQSSFDVNNHPLNCGSCLQVTAVNLDGCRSHELFVLFKGVTID